MTREDKKRNKEHCKNMPLRTRLQCWYFRNETEIKTILLSAITSLATFLIVLTILLLIALAQGADVLSWF